MDALNQFPFVRLELPASESVVWCASNPTFHRSSDYGIAITDRALYLFSPRWFWRSRWRRYSLLDVRHATFRDSYWRPKVVVRVGDQSIAFRTPYDIHQDEMDIDRRHLARAAEILEQAVANGGSIQQTSPNVSA
jgi:hypothetical protein